MKNVINHIVHLVLALSVASCLLIIKDIGKDVEEIQAKNEVLFETIVLTSSVANGNTEVINGNVELVNVLLENQAGLIENQASIYKELRNAIDSLPPVVVETESDLEAAIEAANSAILEIVAKVDKISGEIAAFENLEALVAVQISVDPEVSTVAESVQKPSNELMVDGKMITVDEFKKVVKDEVYEKFIEAGYGMMVNGEFVLRSSFFGAKIPEGDEGKYVPVSPFK